MTRPLDLDLIEKACAEATPGPWRFLISTERLMDPDCGRIVGADGNTEVCDFGNAEQYYPSNGKAPEDADMALILGARSWVPALVEELKLLRKENALFRDVLERHGLLRGPFKIKP